MPADSRPDHAAAPRPETPVGCPECGYDVPPIETHSVSGVYLGWTCQRCGWHPRIEPIVLPEANPDLSDERLRLDA